MQISDSHLCKCESNRQTYRAQSVREASKKTFVASCFFRSRLKAAERRGPAALPLDTGWSVCYSEGAELASGGGRAGRAPALPFSDDLDTENT